MGARTAFRVELMTSPPPPGSVLPVKSANAFLSWLHAQFGKPYVYGGTGPSGYDCSGLIYTGLKTIGFASPPRTSEEQWAAFTHINRSQLQPGDLVFSQWPGDNASPGHVQVYAGNGRVIQAPHTGTKVGYASLSSDTGHIVGYARVPGMTAGGALTSPNGGTGSQLGGLISEAGSLLHGMAEALDWVFGFFAPGQGWRLAFGAGAAVTGYGAGKAYLSDSGSIGGSAFPLAVGLAGVSTMFAFMALRPWPQEAGGSEKPGKYLAEILSGQPPPAGPPRAHETGAIEAGLAVFATAYVASKAASGISNIVGGVGAFLAGLASSGAAEAP
jgi:hypothetical protein